VTDRELRDAAVAALKQTTVSYPEWAKRLAQGRYPGGALSTKWGQAFDLLEQIGTVVEPPPPPPPPPPPGNRPASWFTGPMGTANVIPPAGQGFLLEMYGGIGVTWQQQQTAIQQRETAMGRRFNGYQIQYISTGGSWDHVENNKPLEWFHNRGGLPLVVWSPPGTCAAIASGASDGYINQAADVWKAKGFTIYLRLLHEFDIRYPSELGANGPFVQAWRRVVDNFRQRGATNVGFWWCPVEGGYPDRSVVHASWPGDQYVDWAGSDAYNFCFVNETNCYSSPGLAGWAEWGQVADYKSPISFHDRWGPVKPFVFGEFNTVHDPAQPSRKGQWYRNVPAVARQMEYLAGMCVYDADVSAVEQARNNFWVDHPTSEPSAMQGFVAMAQDSYWAPA
jgi:hypothetical protein